MHIACDGDCSEYMYKLQLVNRKNISESIIKMSFCASHDLQLHFIYLQ